MLAAMARRTMSDFSQAPVDVVVRAAQQDDDQAVAELFRRTSGRARRVAATYCHRNDVDDAVAEGFARALGHLAQLRDPSAAPAWIARCVFRAAMDLSRRRARQRPVGSALDLDQQAGPTAARAAPAAEAALSALDRLAVGRALSELPPGDRQILWLRFHLGFPVREVARTLGLPDGTARRRCFEAGRLLQERYLGQHLQPATGDCVPISRLLCRAVRRDLSATARRRVTSHLGRCPACRARRDELSELVAGSGRLRGLSGLSGLTGLDRLGQAA
jgi:RNA polymerase sigma-70 factor (ECF subfamily)